MTGLANALKVATINGFDVSTGHKHYFEVRDNGDGLNAELSQDQTCLALSGLS